jgi:phosphoribosylaminoimidazolecarboxamide formyltransferase/IMP cyclohydrolase
MLLYVAKSRLCFAGKILREQNGETTLEQRRMFAIKAFDVCTAYDTAISNYFHMLSVTTPFNQRRKSNALW